MANFIDRLSAQVLNKRDDLRHRYHHGEIILSERLGQVVKKHWQFPAPMPRARGTPAGLCYRRVE